MIPKELADAITDAIEAGFDGAREFLTDTPGSVYVQASERSARADILRVLDAFTTAVSERLQELKG